MTKRVDPDKTVQVGDWLRGWERKGYTKFWNVVMLRTDLSAYSKMFYVLLWHFAWLDESEMPHQEQLAALVPCSTRQLSTSVAELAAAGLIESVRRGQGRTNRYVLLEPKEQPVDSQNVRIKKRTIRGSRNAKYAGLDTHIVRDPNQDQVKDREGDKSPSTPEIATRDDASQLFAPDLASASPRTSARLKRTAERVAAPTTEKDTSP